ncbi:MAG TPA: ABC transporter permease [Terracidiphilus sp.]|jgi:predicted permease
MTGLLQDVRFALRQLRKNPGFTFTAVAMLAVAICANSTVFSWINGTMLHPIPAARNAGALVSLERGERNPSPAPPLSYLDYRDLREHNHSFDGMLAYNHDWITLTRGGAQPERIYIANVSSNFFDVLGVKPWLGRFFLPEEETRPDAVPFVVLSHSLWKTHYASDPSIVGKSIEIARHPVTVIGVAPEGFIGAMPGIHQDVWATLNPIGLNAWRMTHRSADFLNVVCRLKPGVTREAGEKELDTMMRGIVAAYPNEHIGNYTISLDPMWRSPFGANGYMASTLPLLLSIAGVVLLLTCVNVATLTLVRFVARRREIAIRQSLGAGRMQLVCQMLMEGATLSVCAGVVAVLLTSWSAQTLAFFIPPGSNPVVLNGLFDWNVIACIVALSVVAGTFCGAFPAWRSSRVPAAEVLKEESASISGGSHNRRLLSSLVIGQVALSLALLVTSGLFLRTLRNMAHANPGFEQDHVLTASVGLNIAGYSNDDAHVLRERILERVAAMPAVTQASLADWVPMNFSRKTVEAYPQGYSPRLHESLEARRADVTPGYFDTLGIPIVAGREFTHADNDNAPQVMIVDETAAAYYWPGQDPLGKKLTLWGGRLFTVVGVARNSRHQFFSERPEPMLYLSYLQNADNETIVQVKTRANPNDLVPAIERAIHEIDSGLPVFDVRPLRETTQMASVFAVMQSTFAGMFALIALILAATGIYGVVAYRTELRTHEIGIRVALGASRTDVLRLVLLQGVWLTAVGLGVGLAVAFALARLISGQLYGINANDPATMVSVLALLAVISLLACYLPARRAMRADPITAIREQ